MKTNTKRAAIIAIGLLVAIQFIPIKRTSSPGTTLMTTPGFEVRAVLQESCFDCHSNETTWPWYSRVAPVSWLVAHDVKSGRDEINFSTWDQLGTRKQAEVRSEIWDEVESGGMPLWYYLPTHPHARLSEVDLATLQAWAAAEDMIESR